MRLTDIAVRNLPPPQKGARVYPDDQIDGFGVRVSQGGTKAFVLIHGRERKRVTLGRYPVVSLAQARDLARKRLAELTLGTGHAAVTAVSVDLTVLVERFLSEKQETLRPRTFGDYKRLLDRHLTFDAKVADITPQRLDAAFKKVTAPHPRSAHT